MRNISLKYRKRYDVSVPLAVSAEACAGEAPGDPSYQLMFDV